MNVRPEGAKEWLLHDYCLLPLQGAFPLVRIVQGAASLALDYVVLRLQRAMFGYIWVSLVRA